MSYSTRSLVNQINKVRKYSQDVFINDKRVSDKVSDGLPTEEESFGIFDYNTLNLVERSSGIQTRLGDIATIKRVIDAATTPPQTIGCMPLSEALRLELEDPDNKILEAHIPKYKKLLNLASTIDSQPWIVRHYKQH